jgi:hypothetical protein
MSSYAFPTESALNARMVLVAGSLLSIIGSAGYAATVIVDSDASAREAFAAPINIVSCFLVTAGLLMILYAFARGRIHGPGWAIVVSATGLFFAAAMTWFFSTGIVAVSQVTTDQQFDDIGNSAWNIMMAAPKMLLCFVGFGAVAISNWKSRSMPRSASAFLGVGALASLLPPFPPGVLLISIGLLIAARSRMSDKDPSTSA